MLFCVISGQLASIPINGGIAGKIFVIEHARKALVQLDMGLALAGEAVTGIALNVGETGIGCIVRVSLAFFTFWHLSTRVSTAHTDHRTGLAFGSGLSGLFLVLTSHFDPFLSFIDVARGNIDRESLGQEIVTVDHKKDAEWLLSTADKFLFFCRCFWERSECTCISSQIGRCTQYSHPPSKSFISKPDFDEIVHLMQSLG